MGGMIDNTLAANVPQFNLANTLQQGAQAQAAQDAVQQEQLKAKQNAIGSEMRGVAPFVNTPEFPQRWEETFGRMRDNGLIDQGVYDRLAKTPSALMIKSITAQTDSPEIALKKTEDDQAQKNTVFSQGIQTQQLGLQKRAADRADDPTPAGFEQNPDAATDPAAPKYRPLQGGPQDPNYLAAVGKAKGDNPTIIGAGSSVIIPNKAADGPLFTNKPVGSTLDDQTVSDMADQYLAGDRTVMQNLGRGAQGAENIVKLRTEISNRARLAGIDPKGIVDKFNEQAGALAGQRAVGTRAANISLAANEANNMIPIALAASEKLPRTQYMPWNQMVQAVQKGSSSPELASFVAATNSLVNSYVRAVSPSGVPTDSMREHAYSMLNAAQGPEAYKAVIDTMQKEMGAALAAPSQVKKELRGETKASAPDRFKQLIGTGLGKEAAYAKMHEEGY